MEDKLNLRDIFDFDLWQKIQESFAQSTGYAAIIVDKNGMPLLQYSNFCDYCLELRESSACQSCYNSDAQGGLMAAETKKPVIYQCHGKLIDFAVPIIVQGEYIGAILAGQTRLYPGEEQELEIDVIPSKHTDEKLRAEEEALLESPEMRELYNRTSFTHANQIKAASDLLYVLANHLVEMRLLSNMQEELHQKEIALSETTRLKGEVESALKMADLEALEAQINPHFLFNVLNTIGRLAMFEDAEQTQEMIYQFADLMRYNLKRNVSNIVTVKDEIDHVKDYLGIQKFRLRDRLNYEISMDPKAADVECPAMIIQPFVENALNHVIEPRVEGGHVWIKVKDEGDEVEITVEDNGDGINPNKASELLKGVYKPKGSSTGLGINNVNRRLMYYFGAEYGVQIGESDEQGTKIIFRIPKRSLEV